MSLRYAVLGMLADAPGSGYELTRRFEATLDQYAWHAKHNQIYQELGRLADESLVEIVDQGARGRKTYAITEAGHETLVAWLRQPPRTGVVRNEFMLRLFLIFALEPQEARAHLQAYADETQRRLDELQTLLSNTGPEADDKPTTEPTTFGHLAAGLGLKLMPAVRDWAREAAEEIDRRYGSEEAQGDD
jgi:PadR family transcriptional regulator, regulatory protein AphA